LLYLDIVRIQEKAQPICVEVQVEGKLILQFQTADFGLLNVIKTQHYECDFWFVNDQLPFLNVKLILLGVILK
jgi:hypothetical protein